MELYEDIYKNRQNFGENWKNFLNNLNDEMIDEAVKSLVDFGYGDFIEGKSFLDFGCGSGLFSLAAVRLKASKVVSVDIDDGCLDCVRMLKNKYYPDMKDWIILKGSVLDVDFVKSLGQFDYVYSWGVLHHTGDVWKSFENIKLLVKDGGMLYISIYNKFQPSMKKCIKYILKLNFGKGFNEFKMWMQGSSSFWLRLKQKYGGFPRWKRELVYYLYKYYFYLGLLATGRNPIAYVKNYKSKRGMSFYDDLRDWLLGYPYEPLAFEEVDDYFSDEFMAINQKKVSTLGCNEFVYKKCGGKGV